MISTFTDQDRELLATLAANLANLERRFSEFVKEYNADPTITSLDKRVRDLENFRYWLLGAGVLLGFIVHILIDYGKKG